MNPRQTAIFEILKGSEGPVSATTLAGQLHVSRQSIVGDIALLRAAGTDITATSKGYILADKATAEHPYIGTLVCMHTDQQLTEELYAIVDLGGTVIDVSIEHAIYGELTGRLELSSRYDVDLYIQKVNENDSAAPISRLTGGRHMHRIGCRDQEVFDRIRNRLTELGIASDY